MSNKKDNSEYNLAYNAIKAVQDYMEKSFSKNMANIDERLTKVEKVNKIDYNSEDCKKNPLYYPIFKVRKTHEDVITEYNKYNAEENGSNMVIISKVINMHENLLEIENKGDGNDE